MRLEPHLTLAQRANFGPGISLLAAAIVGGWLIAVLAQATGEASLLHHHALIEDGPPLWLALPLFVAAWQVMIVAMMLPASLPAIRAFQLGAGARARLALPAFLGAYALVWTAFGVLAFAGDVGVHHVVHETPWLEARPWLIEAGIVALAGAYQFAPIKRASLAACRHPLGLDATMAPAATGSFRLGLEHGLACLGSSWALMLLMFAAGFANLGWMAALTAVMVYEAIGRHGHRAASVAGGILLLIAVSMAVTGVLSVV